MANFWRGAAEVGNVLYDYVGDKKKWELADTTNELQRMRAEKLKSDIEEGKQEGIAMKSVSPYTTTTTETPEYQGVVSPPDPNEGYAAPPESALMRQTTTQTPKPSYQFKRDIAQALAARGQTKAANLYFDDAAKEEQVAHTNLWNSLKFATEKGDDNLSNSILENAPDSFLQATGMKRGDRFTGGGRKLEGSIDASKTPFYDAYGVYQTEGMWDVIRERGQPTKTILKSGGGEKAPTVHSFIEGQTHVNKQWNPATKTWDVLSSGPRYKEGGGASAKLTMSDVKSGYGMDMAGIKNRIALDLINSPSEAQALSGQPAENIMALLMSGNLKSIPLEKKQAYMDEIKQIEEYYSGLSSGVLGKKGAAPKAAKQATPAQPSGKTVTALPQGSKMIGYSGGKEVWSPDGGKTRYVKE